MGTTGAAFLASTLCIALLCNASSAKTTSLPTQVVDGACVHSGIRITDGETRHSTQPCEAWTCMAADNKLVIEVCPQKLGGKGCKLAAGAVEPFPGCCPTMMCAGV
uniref:Putative 8.9 kDa protein n=1 Tax=Ixodes scapularis TaxID=6945 RepID=A0A4D5RQZ2_IXOSC